MNQYKNVVRMRVQNSLRRISNNHAAGVQRGAETYSTNREAGAVTMQGQPTIMDSSSAVPTTSASYKTLSYRCASAAKTLYLKPVFDIHYIDLRIGEIAVVELPHKF